MRNLLLTLRFCGTPFCGFQVQKNGVSIMEKVQDAIEAVTGVRSDVKGCSRTDSGVHARMYCLSFQTESGIDSRRFPLALSANLPDEIAVMACQEVPLSFHARYSCTGKEYLYLLHNAPVRDPLLQGRAYEYPAPLNLDAMGEAGTYLLGTQDFQSFSGRRDKDNTVRTITHFRLEQEGALLRFFIRGDGFLFHMVRIIVGTLVWVGAGRLTPKQIPDIIVAKNRQMAGMTAPAHGLYLNQVFYGLEWGDGLGAHSQYF